MKDKPNEWVSISDLMAGVMAVVMLLLVMAVLQKTYADIRHKQQLDNGANAEWKIVSDVLQEVKNSFSQQGSEGLASFDLAAGKITLRDNVFSRGSACLTPQAQAALADVGAEIARFLERVGDGQVLVEGHTDSLPVLHPVTDLQRFCTVYDDNYTLSAARAREVRKLLITSLQSGVSRRVVVAGYGDSQTLPGEDPESGKNRRVEVRLMLRDLPGR